LEKENRIVFLYLLNHQKNNTTMRNTILFLFCLLPFVSFSQVVYNDGYISVEVCEFNPQKRTINNITSNNGEISLSKFYIDEGNPNEKVVTQQSDSFTKNVLSNFSVDNEKTPTKLTLKSTNLTIELIGNDNELHSYVPFHHFLVDSVLDFKTNHDFRIGLVYVQDKIVSIEINFDSITENSFNMAYEWFKTLPDIEKLNCGVDINDKIGVLGFWMDSNFIGSIYKNVHNKDYVRNLIKNKRFTFLYTKFSYNI
jgi:hypothetical protein